MLPALVLSWPLKIPRHFPSFPSIGAGNRSDNICCRQEMYLPTLYECASIFLFAQEGDGAAEAVNPAEEAAKPTGLFSGMGGLMLPIMLVLMVYLFLMIFPNRKEKQRMKAMMDNLKKNDRVLTNAGIKGTIVNIQKDSPWVTIRIDESTNAKMQILRSTIGRVLTGEDKEDVEQPEKK